jgi:hypothetical protein
MELDMNVNIGKGIELAVPALDTLSPAVRDHIMYIGWRNILMDSHAGVTAEKSTDVVGESKAIAEKKLAALIAGEVRTASFRTVDPVKREMLRLATEAVEKAIRAKGKKVSDFDAAVRRAKAESVMDKFAVQARKNVEANNAVSIDIDL